MFEQHPPFVRVSRASQTKCSVVSRVSPHAGQRALSIFLKRWRYSFSGECPTLSWKIRLAIRLVILWSLVSIMNFIDAGEMISGAFSLLNLSKCRHSIFQAAFQHLVREKTVLM